jgi:prepilin-type processing-associated H-X9-DG protein
MRSVSRRKSAGFSSVELVVVLAISAVLGSLLPSAIQDARENARRTMCRNNLKQIALAMHNYHDVNIAFPMGWIDLSGQVNSRAAYGWQTRLLPYLEQVVLYNRLNFNQPMPSQPTDDLKTTIPTYRCPSDPTEATNSMRSNFGTSNYSGNFGSIPAPRWAPGPLAQYWPGAVASLPEPNGILMRNVCIRIADIVDGTSNTMMAGERSIKSAAGIWPGVSSSQNETDQVTDCSGGNEMNSGIGAFSSLHPGGANFALCDGSARFIVETIQSGASDGQQMGVYQLLACRNDLQVFSLPR